MADDTLRNVPAELRELRQWVAYKAFPSRTRPGKTDKVPVNPATGENASSTDPATWGTFEAALSRANRDRLAGIGFVFTQDDPYTGIDFDGVIDADGNVEQWVLDCLWRCNSYAERSRSGTGVHIIARGNLPPSGRKHGPVEMYDSGRFFVCTGDVLLGYDTIRDAQEAIDLIHREQIGAPSPKAEPVPQPAQPIDLDDAELIDKATNAKNGHKFHALWHGNIVGYGSQSEADLALCSQLVFWTGGDAKRVDSLFRQSGLYREKWDQRHYADGRTYGQATIEKALGTVREVYDGNGRQPPDLDLIQTDTLEPPDWLEPDGLDLGDMPSVTASRSDVEEAISSEPPRVLPEPKADLVECPPLPESAQLDPALSVGASPWLDAYDEFSRRWSPESWDGYHVNVGLGVLSTVAARRVRYDFGGERYTSLMLADVGRSTVHAKSTAQKLGRKLLQAAGIDFLLVADTTTPQALVRRMALTGVSDWDAIPVDQRDLARLRVGFAAQRGWFADEFGTHIGGMMRSDGPMADFVGLLRVLDDGLPRYESDTIIRGSAVIDSPYLALLVSFTPADVAKYAGRGGSLWLNGFWGRFSFACPPPHHLGREARFPDGPCVFPPDLVADLRQWHERLGLPQVEITERLGEDGKPLKERTWDTHVVHLAPTTCLYTAEVKEAFYNYRSALRRLVGEGFTTTDLDANYGRLPEQALRVAAILGSFENHGMIELRHWARAQEIAEGWRQGVHNLYASINVQQDKEGQLEDKILDVYTRLGGATVADLRRYVRNLSVAEATTVSDRLVKAGVLRAVTTRTGTKRYTPREQETK